MSIPLTYHMNLLMQSVHIKINVMHVKINNIMIKFLYVSSLRKQKLSQLSISYVQFDYSWKIKNSHRSACSGLGYFTDVSNLIFMTTLKSECFYFLFKDLKILVKWFKVIEY